MKAETIQHIKSIAVRLLVLLTVFVVIQTLMLVGRSGESTIGRHVAVSVVNGGDAEFMQYAALNAARERLFTALNFAFLLVMLGVLFAPSRKLIASISAGAMILATSGCVKPYNTPEFAEIKNNETAFVVPLEGDTKDQAKFQSEEFLKTRKTAQITRARIRSQMRSDTRPPPTRRVEAMRSIIK